jgi:hypothetical protein
MPEYAAALQRLVLSRTLWLVVAWPLAGLAWQLLVARPRIERARDAGAVLRELALARVAGVGGVALASTASLGHALLMARLPPGSRVLYEPLLRGARFGSLDAGIDLLLDPSALAACGLACAVTLAAAVVIAGRPAPERGWRPWAWLHLALAGSLLAFLADGFVTAAVGWTLAVVATAWLAAWHRAAAGEAVAMRGALAVAAMVAAAALLFWGAGGSWDDGGYTPEPRPRFAVARTGSGGPEASLTMTTVAGAQVFVDDARTTELRAPFVRAVLPPGPHALRVHPGDGAEDVLLARVTVAPGDELALVPLGPTLSFHAMADALALRERGGQPAIRRALEDHVGPGGVAVVAGALLALLAAAAAMSVRPPALAAPRALAGVAAAAGAGAVGPFLLLRLEVLFPSAQHTGAVVAAAGAAVLLAAVWQALGFVGARRWLAFSASAPPGLVLVALGLGGAARALEVMAVAGAVGAGAHLVSARRGDVDEAIAAASRGAATDPLLVRLPARVGELLASMERWVVGAVAGAIAGCARVAAWVVATVDEHVVSSPADVAASGLERAAAAIEPVTGVSAGRIAWALVGLAAVAALLHAAWPGG